MWISVLFELCFLQNAMKFRTKHRLCLSTRGKSRLLASEDVDINNGQRLESGRTNVGIPADQNFSLLPIRGLNW